MYGGFTYTKETHETKIGPLVLSVTDKETCERADLGWRGGNRDRRIAPGLWKQEELATASPAEHRWARELQRSPSSSSCSAETGQEIRRHRASADQVITGRRDRADGGLGGWHRLRTVISPRVQVTACAGVHAARA